MPESRRTTPGVRSTERPPRGRTKYQVPRTKDCSYTEPKIRTRSRSAPALASRGPCVDLLRLLAQLPAQDLADIGLRQFGPELHQTRDLVGREPRPAVGDQVRSGEVWIFLDDEQLHRLAGARIGDADHPAFEHSRVARHYRLDLIRIDVETGHRDHVLLAIDDPGPAGLVHDADIASQEEAVGSHDLGRLFGTFPVARHHLRAARTDLARLPKRHLVVSIGANRDLR